MKNFINNALQTARDSIKFPKEARKENGEENVFIKPHEKDRPKTHVSDVERVPNIIKGSKFKYIKNNVMPSGSKTTPKNNYNNK